MEYTVIPATNGNGRLIVKDSDLDYWMYTACKAYNELKWVNRHFVDGGILKLYPHDRMLVVEDHSVDLHDLNDARVRQLTASSVAKPIEKMWMLYDGCLYLVALEPILAVFMLADAETLENYRTTKLVDDEEDTIY